MIPHIWFRKGGYILHMVSVMGLSIPSTFWRTFWRALILRPMAFLTRNRKSVVDQSFEKRLYDALWLNSVGIRLEPGDMVISNSWVTPHARLPTNEGKKLRTVEFFPCDSISERTQCGNNFEFEDLEALAKQRMDYQKGLTHSGAKW